MCSCVDRILHAVARQGLTRMEKNMQVAHWVENRTGEVLCGAKINRDPVKLPYTICPECGRRKTAGTYQRPATRYVDFAVAA